MFVDQIDIAGNAHRSFAFPGWHKVFIATALLARFVIQFSEYWGKAAALSRSAIEI